LEYPKLEIKSIWAGSTYAEEKPGIIPLEEPFAFSRFTHCPTGYWKINENDGLVHLNLHYRDGSGGASLVVPSILWGKFTNNKKWQEAVTRKYAKLLVLEKGSATVSEFERNKTGIVPEDEL
jgi:hypothetical protein